MTKLPQIPKTFVEFGVNNYEEANTRFLLQHRAWRGIVIDGNAGLLDELRSSALHWKYDITPVEAFITTENINQIIKSGGLSGEIGLLSVDIDGNDYWVLQAIEVINPIIIIAEVNGVFGDRKSLTIPYDPEFQRLHKHYSGQYYGCSIRGLDGLMSRKGYKFLGTGTSGVNAFYVRLDFYPYFEKAILHKRVWPQHHRDTRDASGNLTYNRGKKKLVEITHLPVVDLDTNRLIRLADAGDLYSPGYLGVFDG